MLTPIQDFKKAGKINPPSPQPQISNVATDRINKNFSSKLVYKQNLATNKLLFENRQPVQKVH